MKRSRWASLLLVACVGLSGQRADAMRTPLADVRAAITQPHQLTAATAPSDVSADAWLVESIIPLGHTADGQPLALISLLVPNSSLDELPPASTRAGPYAAPETHTRVFCIVQPPLGLATEEWFDKTYTYDIATHKVSTEWNQPSLDIDGRFKDYNTFSRYSVPMLPPGNYSIIENPWQEFSEVGEGRLSFGFFPSFKPKIQIGPLKGKMGLGYENSIDVKYAGGVFKETTSEKWSVAFAINKGKKAVFGGEYSYARSTSGYPDLEYYGPFYRREYTQLGLPITVARYKPESNRHYLKRKRADWEHDWQWQIAPGVGGMSDTYAKKLKIKGNADDWKLEIGGSYIIVKGSVGINLTELYDFISKSIGYEGVKP